MALNVAPEFINVIVGRDHLRHGIPGRLRSRQIVHGSIACRSYNVIPNLYKSASLDLLLQYDLNRLHNITRYHRDDESKERRQLMSCLFDREPF